MNTPNQLPNINERIASLKEQLQRQESKRQECIEVLKQTPAIALAEKLHSVYCRTSQDLCGRHSSDRDNAGTYKNNRLNKAEKIIQDYKNEGIQDENIILKLATAHLTPDITETFTTLRKLETKNLQENLKKVG